MKIFSWDRFRLAVRPVMPTISAFLPASKPRHQRDESAAPQAESRFGVRSLAQIVNRDRPIVVAHARCFASSRDIVRMNHRTQLRSRESRKGPNEIFQR
jgi:hypothetical protein